MVRKAVLVHSPAKDVARFRAKGAILIVERFFAVLVMALRSMRAVERAAANRRATPEAVERLMDLRVERIKAERKKKPRKKLEMLKEGYNEEIRKLRQEKGLGWRQCAAYVERFHCLKASPGYLQKTFGGHMI